MYQNKEKRILIVDDNESIHQDFKKVLQAKNTDVSFEEAKSIMFGKSASPVAAKSEKGNFIIDSAFQGQEALEMIKKSLADNQPYALAFVDVLMPPGWDGVVTVQKIWEVDPNIQIVICTAYSEYSWNDMSRILHDNDNFLILKKPFDSIEIQQLTSALTKKWELKRQVQSQIENLETAVNERTLDLKKANIELAHNATHDILTGLPNRSLLMDRIHQAIALTKRGKLYVGVLLLDLDNLKHVNDSLGHNAGDELLISIAKTLSGLVRESDSIARLGGDEFVIVLNSYPKEEDILYKTHKILEILNHPLDINNHKFTVTASIGVSIYPKHGNDPETLLKNADSAMYHAKQTGKNKLQVYSEEFNQDTLERAELASALSQAIKNNELLLHYQPLVELNTGKIIGMEALIRWNHPVLGIIPPNKFIPIAEDTGLIVSIGEWVLSKACKQNKIWQDTVSPDLCMAVNVSPYQFQQHNFIDIVRKALLESELQAKYLELEITESLILGNATEIYQKMDVLKKIGVRFSMDDFGTGYASLNYLKTFPFDKVKIDKSFIDDIASSGEDSSIVEAIIAMTKNLNIKVLAEGVEKKEQVDFLLKHHSNQVQGYYFSPPADEKACTELLKTQFETT